MNRQPLLLIVDGHAYAYRAFHAIRGLRSPSGAPTNAIYGFVKTLAKLRAVVGPTHWLVVWDGGKSAERTAALPEYKQQRPAMPDDLRSQLDEIVAYLTAAGVAWFRRDGVEADDYIACLARRAAELGWRVVIASSDKDFMQLVRGDEGRVTSDVGGAGAARHPSPPARRDHAGSIGLWNPHDKTEKIWTRAEVRAKAGVEPEQVADWLALMGDSVDNIPGVPGVGPKTAAELLNRFGSVAELFARLDEVEPEKLRAALHASAAAVRRNQKLTRLQDDLPCDFSPAELAVKPADAGQLRELFARWGFKGLLAALEAETPRERQAALI